MVNRLKRLAVAVFYGPDPTADETPTAVSPTERIIVFGVILVLFVFVMRMIVPF